MSDGTEGQDRDNYYVEEWVSPWTFNLGDMPVDEPVLVFLAEKLCGSRIHAAKKGKTMNGYLIIVATIFGHDAPQILAWRPMVDDPKQAAEAAA